MTESLDLEAASSRISKKMLLPLYCKAHNKPVTHICLQSDCSQRLNCLQCNSLHDESHHKRIYALNTALNENELSLLFDQVEDKYSDFSKNIDEKIEDVIKSSNI